MNKIYKNEPCPHCENFTNRGVSVDAVIIKGNKVLLIRRGVNPFKGYWATPGGYVGWDETIEETVIREVKEETGLQVTSLTLAGVNSSPKRHPKQVINFIYRVKTRGQILNGDDAVDCKWFDLKDLPGKLAFDHKQNTEDAKKISQS